MKRFMVKYRNGIVIYAIILGLFLLGGIGAATYLGENMVERQNAEIMAGMQADKSMLEGYFQSANTLLTLNYQRIQSSPVVQMGLDISLKDRFDIYLAKSLISETKSRLSGSDDWPIKDVLFYFTGPSIAVSPSTMYTLSNLCTLYFNTDQASFVEMLSTFRLSGRVRQMMWLPGSGGDEILYLRKFSLPGASGDIVGICVLDKNLFALRSVYGGVTYVAAQSEFVSGTDALAGELPRYAALGEGVQPHSVTIEGTPYALMWMQMGADMRLATAMPMSSYLRDVQSVWWLMVWGMVALGMMTCAVLYSTRRRYAANMSEISQILQQNLPRSMHPADPGRVGLEQIRGGLMSLIRQNDELKQEHDNLQDEIEGKYAFLRGSFLRKIIIGEVDAQELRHTLKLYRIDDHFERYRVMLVLIGSQIAPGEVDQLRQMVLVALNSMLECRSEACFVDDYTVGVLIMYNEVDAVQLRERLRGYTDRLKATMLETRGARISIGLGSAVDSIGNCLPSYYEARTVLRSSQPGRRAVDFDERDEQLMHILNALEQGNAPLCLRLFDGLFQPGEQDPEHCRKDSILVLLDLFDGVVRGNVRLKRQFASDQNLYRQLGECASFEDILSVTRGMLRSACECLGDSGENRSKLQMDRALRIIQDKYMDPNLSQAEIAEQLGLNPSTLSAQFKEIVGVNMSAYIGYLRIKQVKRLLAETEMPLESVAEQSGFNSLKTMYRMFKAQVDLSPGQYRDRMKSDLGI